MADPKTRDAEKRERLAAALRANLKRRKAGADVAAPDEPPPDQPR